MLQSERAKRGETREYLHYYKLQQKQSLTATKKEAGKITASGRIHTKGQVAGMTHMQWATVRLRGRLPPVSCRRICVAVDQTLVRPSPYPSRSSSPSPSP